jgi:hypothetical protein
MTLAATKPLPAMTMTHEQIAFVEAVSIPQGTIFETPEVLAEAEFIEALVSWNVSVPEAAGLVVELSVRRAEGSSWSPWLLVGDWGQVDRSVSRTTAFDGGRIDIDFFTGDINFNAIRLRFTSEGQGDLLVHRYDLCLTGANELEYVAIIPGSAATSLDVPKRSQQISDRELAARICSPTSVAMVMAYRGVSRPTVEVAKRLFDEPHDIYGNWTRAIQGAFSFGVPGYLRRFSSLESAEAVVASGQPLIVSIRVPDSGLTGAPYVATTGHLVVIVGFDDDGDVIVNDPAAPDPDSVRLTYKRDEIDRAWLGKGGVAYMLLQP